MGSNMTFFAESLNIKPMISVITEMMMVIFCLISAIDTRQTFRVSEISFFNCSIYCVCSFLLNIFRWRKASSLFSLMNTAACKTWRPKARPSIFIYSKKFLRSPLFTDSTPFQSIIYIFLILFKRKPQSFSSYFQYTKFRTHIISLYRMVNNTPFKRKCQQNLWPRDPNERPLDMFEVFIVF